MRKNVLCVVAVLLGGGLASAQHGPPSPSFQPGAGAAAGGQPQAYPQFPGTSSFQMPANAAGAGWGGYGGYPAQGGYGGAYPGGYGQHQGGYPAMQGFQSPGYGYGWGYPVGNGGGYPYVPGAANGATGSPNNHPATNNNSTPSNNGPGSAIGGNASNGKGPTNGNGPNNNGPNNNGPNNNGPNNNGPNNNGPNGNGHNNGSKGSDEHGPPFPFGYGPGFGPRMPIGIDEDAQLERGILERDETLWFNITFLLGRLRKTPLATPLVTTGSVLDVNQGALGQPGTAVAFGRDNLGFGLTQGLTAEWGIFLDPDHRYSVDFRGFFIFPERVDQTFASDGGGNPLIARPVFNTQTGQEGSFQTSVPGGFSGVTTVNYRTNLLSAEINGRCHIPCDTHVNWNWLVGYRYANLREDLKVTDRLTAITPGNLTFLGQPLDPPGFLVDQDEFKASNSFNGINLGAKLLWQHEYCFFELSSRTAVGMTTQQVEIRGVTTAFPGNGPPQTTLGGILALPSNIGRYKRSVFGVIPEASLSVGAEPCKNVRVIAGYSFLWWNSVVRPGTQIDRLVNPGAVPSGRNFGQSNSSNRPVFSMNNESIWFQALNFGLEFYY